MSTKTNADDEALKLHANAHTVRDRLTLKDVKERHFRIDSFRELQSSNETQMNTNTETQTNSNNESTSSLVHSYKDAMLESHNSKTNSLLCWFVTTITVFCLSIICTVVPSSFSANLFVYCLFFFSLCHA